METPAHPRFVRITHWINALSIVVLLWSGFAMLVADRHFAAYVHVVPNAVWSALHLTGQRSAGRAWHLGMATLFVANAIVYAVSSLALGTWRRFAPRRTWLRDAWRAVVDELTAPRASLEPAEYNGAQRLAYTGVMAAGAVMVYTGLALWFGRKAPWMLAVLGGERTTLTIHVVLAVSLLLFIAVHVAQVLRAGLPTLLGMITGSTTQTPARARRALGWTSAVAVTLLVAFTAANASAGSSGVPPFLRWAAPAHRGGGGGATAPHRHRRDA
ncbi:MAG TPA: cytochrome b/b6 domain-containing protein [Candidatus Elarobacter sp.]|jgi:thiosulfate reductase cytochrome b subunit|nr:cytochrome b/b6 domain-containing protein [Candidatus Elarobacter sp.]